MLKAQKSSKLKCLCRIWSGGCWGSFLPPHTYRMTFLCSPLYFMRTMSSTLEHFRLELSHRLQIFGWAGLGWSLDEKVHICCCSENHSK